MTWRLALGPKVLAGLDQTGTEELLPETIHGDPRRQRMTVVDQPVCQVQTIVRTATGFLGITRFVRKRREKTGDATGHFLARIVVCAAEHHKTLARLGQIGHDHRDRRGLFDLRDLFFDRRLFGNQRRDQLRAPGVFLAHPQAKDFLCLRLGPLVRFPSLQLSPQAVRIKLVPFALVLLLSKPEKTTTDRSTGSLSPSRPTGPT